MAIHSGRIRVLVADAVHATLAGGLSDIRMSQPVLDALLDLRAFLFRDAAARDFLAGMTDRYAVALYEHLFEF